MFDIGIGGFIPFVEDEEESKPATQQSPAPPPCVHHKVYAARNERPYPWICSACLATGEDEQYPVCDSNLYAQLRNQLAGGAEVHEEPGKIRPCYYCGRHVIGHFSDLEPVRCGQCI